MPRLQSLRSGLQTVKPRLSSAVTLSEQRISGRRRMDRRLRMWTDNPCCAMCGRLTEYPRGFELDHVVRLDQGGADTEANSQVLCVHWGDDGKKLGCHAEKTKAETQGQQGR